VVRFHGQIGEQKVYHVPRDEAAIVPLSFPELGRVAVRGCFPPHVMELMGALMRGGLLSSRPVRFGDAEMASIEVVRALLAENPISKENPIWGYGLVVEVVGERAGRRVTCTYRSKHPPQEEWGGESAYFKNVGIPLSIGAQLIARGQTTGKGVLPPERALPVGSFFAELARRGITVDEEIVEEGELA
jgi:saccharopine dehydrogenase-like NADP-dependent oxidoreductase